MRRIPVLLVFVLMFALLAVVPASAEKPLKVDCDLFATTGNLMDDFLDATTEGGPDNLGQSLKAMKADWENVRKAILFFSGGEIDLESAVQANTTAAKCGLVKFTIDNIRD